MGENQIISWYFVFCRWIFCNKHSNSRPRQSTKNVLGTPRSDSTKIRWQGILRTIPNGITRIGNSLPPLPRPSTMFLTRYDHFNIIKALSWGKRDVLIDSFTDIVKVERCAKTFVQDRRNSGFERLQYNKNVI